MEKDLYNLKLHELLINFGIAIMRVPGGWIYDCWDLEKDMFKKGQFVPFSDEFAPKKANQEKKQSTKSKPIDERKTEFVESVRPFLDRYESEMLNEFAGYWTEPNKPKTKMRFEMQQTWDTSRRLANWAKTNDKFDKKDNNEQPKTRIKGY